MYKERRKTCEECNKEFLTRKPTTRFCSILCSKKGWRNNLYKGKNSTNYLSIKLICPTCQKAFAPKEIRETTKYCSTRCSKLGKNNPNWQSKDMLKAENHPSWKGDKVGIDALHTFVKSRFPKPELCQCCGLVAPKDLANISNEYKRDLSDWEWLCRKCHMTKDGRLKKFIHFKRIKTHP